MSRATGQELIGISKKIVWIVHPGVLQCGPCSEPASLMLLVATGHQVHLRTWLQFLPLDRWRQGWKGLTAGSLSALWKRVCDSLAFIWLLLLLIWNLSTFWFSSLLLASLSIPLMYLLLWQELSNIWPARLVFEWYVDGHDVAMFLSELDIWLSCRCD